MDHHMDQTWAATFTFMDLYMDQNWAATNYIKTVSSYLFCKMNFNSPTMINIVMWTHINIDLVAMVEEKQLR